MDTSRSTASRKGDPRIVNLAKEVSKANDRKVPGILLQLKPILEGAPANTEEGETLRRELWQFNLLKVLVLIIRQDYSIIVGEWKTAAKLATILCHGTCGLSLSVEDSRLLEEDHLPKCVENILLLSRHINGIIVAMEEDKASKAAKNDLLVTFKTVLDSLVRLCAGYFYICAKVLSSQWLLQLLVTDTARVSNITMATIEKLLRLDPQALSKMDEESVLTIMDELIYKLTVNTDVSIAAGSCRCLLRMCDHHRPLVEVLCTRYKGLRYLLKRWEGHGFERDLRHVGMLLDSGSALKAKAQRNHECARYIQAIWRGYVARKKLRLADMAFTKFQKAYRLKKAEDEQVKLQTQFQTDLVYRMKMQRQKIVRRFNERRLQALEIMPAGRIEEYLRKEKAVAALRIQTLWRGHRERQQMSERQKVAVQVKAVIKIQRAVRKWLDRVEMSRQEIPTHLKPPGLTDDRRVELNAKIMQWREENPTHLETKEDLQAVHNKTQEMLGKYYYRVRGYRRLQYKVENAMTRLNTDAEMVALAPSLKDITQEDVDMFSSRSLPIATAAKMKHGQTLKRLNLPWWKTLGMEDDNDIDEDQKERVEAEVFLETIGV